MGPSNFVDEYRLARLPKKLRYANFKRKVADDEVEPETILKRYRTEFPNEKIAEGSLEWVHSDDMHMLYDCESHKTRFIMSDTLRPIMIGDDESIKKFDYKLDPWTPNSLPDLCNGALVSIFKHLQGWHLLQCRLVCKQWAKLIREENSLWELPRLPKCTANYWPRETSLFRRYVCHMFLNAKDADIIRFLFQKPKLFHFICCLYTDQSGYHVQLKRGKNRLRVARYMLVNDAKKLELRCDNTKKISVQLFMDAYRQYLTQ